MLTIRMKNDIMLEKLQERMQLMKKFLAFCLAVCLLACLIPQVRAYEAGQAFRLDLSGKIENPQRREYVEMMLDHYIRTDTMVQQALEGGFSAVFLFDGASDNMDDTELRNLRYYRVSGICIVVKLDSDGEPKMIYFNDNASTIPDRPLEYGTWALPEVGEVGPATICDGTYQVYSVRHKGKYEALHVRTEYHDALVDAVYMTPEGYVSSRASEINVHTRTNNHTNGTEGKVMWSAGCPLVGDGDSWEFWKLVYATYYTTYENFEVGNFLGTLTIDRQALREELYKLYELNDAVDMFLTNSRNQQPEQYLRTCTDRETYKRKEEKRITLGTQLMTLPCCNATDARSLVVNTLAEGDTVQVTGSIRNNAGNLWYQVEAEGFSGYVFAGHVEKDSFADWLFEKLFT